MSLNEDDLGNVEVDDTETLTDSSTKTEEPDQQLEEESKKFFPALLFFWGIVASKWRSVHLALPS